MRNTPCSNDSFSSLITKERTELLLYFNMIVGGITSSTVYPGMYCFVLPVHEQYSEFLKTYKIKSIMHEWYCIVKSCRRGCVVGENTLVWSIWTNITGFIVKILTSVRKHMQNSAQRCIFDLFVGSYCAFNVENGFLSRPYACPPCVCVTGLTGHAT